MRFAALPASAWLILACLSPCFAADPAPDPRAAEFFESRVRPVLADNCVSCHGPEKQRGGLRIDTRTAFLKGADSGHIVDGADAEKSKLVHAVRQDGEHKMPPSPRAKLPQDAVDALTAWVQMGAPWPDGPAVAAKGISIDEAQTPLVVSAGKDAGGPADKRPGMGEEPYRRLYRR